MQSTPYGLRKRKEAPTRYEDEQIPKKRRKAPATSKRKTPPTKSIATEVKRRSFSVTRKSTTTPEPASDSATLSQRSVSHVTPVPEPNGITLQDTNSSVAEQGGVSHRDHIEKILPRSLAPKDLVDKLVAYSQKVEKLKQLGKDYGKGLEVDGVPTLGADSSLKAETLPVLKHLTVRLLHVFATSSIHDLVATIADTKSEAGSVCRAHLEIGCTKMKARHSLCLSSSLKSSKKCMHARTPS